MIRGTTPIITLTIGSDDLDLTEATAVHVTIKQGHTIIDKTEADVTIEGNVISFRLSEAESLLLTEGSVAIQVNWTSGTRRMATVVASEPVRTQLLRRAIT